MELLSKLGIDWKLLIAQIVNFTILLSVLAYFVYKPLLNLLDARREKIRKAMEDVERVSKQTQEMERIRTEKLRTIDEEAGKALERAKKQAEEMKSAILFAAEKEAAELLAKGKEQLAAERAALLREIEGKIALLIIRMTEKLLEREFSPADQDRLMTTLEKQIPSLVR